MKLKKYEGNPILKPDRNNQWESLCVLNPAAVYEDGVFYLLYRAAGNDEEHLIHLGLAKSEDGFHFERCFDKPVMSPDLNHAEGGCEDPRIVKFGDWYYITYAARPHPPGQYWKADAKTFGDRPEYGPHFMKQNNTVSYLAISKDLVHYNKLGRVTDTHFDDHDVVIFPEKINNEFVMFSRPIECTGEEYGCEIPSVWISFSDDLLEWRKRILFMTKQEWWEDKKIGASTPPIKTQKGWLFLYHGVSRKDDAYRVGAMLLDLENPAKILARTKEPIMEPELDYETSGYYNGCVFPTGNVVVNNTLYVYYGAADHYCCVATCDLDELVNHLASKCAI